jgi:N4-gp56 family major capsid protein
MAGQIWAVNSLGGFFYAQNLSQELRDALQPMERFRQFCDVKNAAGKNKGETFTWDIVSNVSTAGGVLVETNTIPETQFTITQATLTVTEAGNAVPYSGKLEALSQFAVRQPVMTALRNDANKFLDRRAAIQFNSAQLRYVGTSATGSIITTNGTATVTNTSALNTFHIKAIVDYMKERNIPAYVADDYMVLAWPSTYRSLKNSMETLHTYTETGLKMIFNGEIGRYENCRFTEQTNVAKGITTDGGVTGAAWTGSLSDWTYFFGEDTVAEGLAIPLEMRAKIPTDYGRSKGVAWYWLGGYGIVHSVVAEQRIVKWDTGA